MIEFKIKDDKGISITLANTKIQKINIKQYINNDDKIKFVTLCVNNYFDNYELVVKGKPYVTNRLFAKERIFVYCIFKFFTDLELEDELDVEKFYNNVVCSGVYQKVFNEISMDVIWQIKDDISNSIKEYNDFKKEMNSIEIIIKDFLEKITEKIPTKKQINAFVKKVPKMINEIDKEKLELLKNSINNVINQQKINK